MENVIEGEERDPFDYERLVNLHGRGARDRVVKLALSRIGRQIGALIKGAAPFGIPVEGRLWVSLKLGISTKEKEDHD